MSKKNWVYDLETLPNFFCAVFKCENDIRVFEISNRKNDYEPLYMFLRTEVNALKGYNNLHFDSQIIEYIWDIERTAYDICNFAQKVINEEQTIYPEYKLHILNLDIFKILHLDNKNRRVGLKWCQYMIDWENIEDMPFYRAVASSKEADEIIEYCKNDVLSTEHLFNINQKEIQLRINLGIKYKMNFLNASNSKIGSELMLDLYCKKTNRLKSEVRHLRTERSIIRLKDIIFPYIKFDSDEFSGLLAWFKDRIIQGDDKIQKSFNYKGFQFDYGLGGIHGSVHNQIVTIEDDEMLIDADVASLYPSIAVVNKLYPEHLGPEFAEVYGKDIVSVRLAEKNKPNGDKTIIAGLKEAANSVYGKSNDNYSWLKDYQYTLATTINGQLMLTMLAEKLMIIGEIIQINTDGLTLKIKKKDEQSYYTICKEWEKTTNLILEYAEYSKMIIRDVNNYIAVYTNGKTKCKGSFEFDNLPLHKNKSALIIRIALFNYFTKGIDVEETIRNHTNIYDFCIGARTKSDSKFFYLDKNANEYPLSKTIRYYISNRGIIIKKRFTDGRVHYLDVHPQKGRAWYQTIANKINNSESYDINYAFYIKAAKDDIYDLLPKNKLL